MEMLKEYLAKFEEEKRVLENSDDEDIIKQQVAEFEASLRKDFAEMKKAKIDQKETEIAVLKKVLAMEEDKKAQSTGEEVDDGEDVVVVEYGDEDFSSDKEIVVDPNNPFSGI